MRRLYAGRDRTTIGAMKTKTLSWTLAAALVAAGGAAGAAEGGGGAPAKPFFGVSAGLKGGIGGNYLTEPEDVYPPGAILYDDGAGGFGGGGGLYAEFRLLWGHLGLELDVLFEGNKNWSEVEFSNVVDTDWIYRFQTVRLPLLLEGSVENDLMRGSLGLGPEFVVGTKSGTDIQVTDGGEYVEEGAVAALEEGFRSKDQTDTFLCVGVGMAFKVWKLAISLDLRYAYNLTQPKDYQDRTALEPAGDGFTAEVVASSTMDLRILLGIAYEVGFGGA